MSTPRVLADLVSARAQAAPQFETYRSDLITERPAKGYVVFFFGAGTTERERYVAWPRCLRWHFRVTCVGYSDEHALYVAETLRALLAGWRADEDRAASPLNEVNDDPPLIRDDVEGDVRWSVTLRFEMYTPLT
jgi:hypothetical protein